MVPPVGRKPLVPMPIGTHKISVKGLKDGIPTTRITASNVSTPTAFPHGLPTPCDSFDTFNTINPFSDHTYRNMSTICRQFTLNMYARYARYARCIHK